MTEKSATLVIKVDSGLKDFLQSVADSKRISFRSTQDTFWMLFLLKSTNAI